MSNDDAIKSSLENAKKIEALKSEINILEGRCTDLKSDMGHIKDRQTRQEGYIVDLFNEMKDHRLDNLKATGNLKESMNDRMSNIKDVLTIEIKNLSESINEKLEEREKEDKAFQIQTVQKLSILMFALSLGVVFLNYLLKL
jgi:predicted  nucleic acid-binding Zn-ribbon protein